MSKTDYGRKDYSQLAKEFKCHLRIGKYGVKFFPANLVRFQLISIIPLDGWITDPKEVERIIRENGMEL